MSLACSLSISAARITDSPAGSGPGSLAVDVVFRVYGFGFSFSFLSLSLPSVHLFHSFIFASFLLITLAFSSALLLRIPCSAKHRQRPIDLGPAYHLHDCAEQRVSVIYLYTFYHHADKIPPHPAPPPRHHHRPGPLLQTRPRLRPLIEISPRRPFLGRTQQRPNMVLQLWLQTLCGLLQQHETRVRADALGRPILHLRQHLPRRRQQPHR